MGGLHLLLLICFFSFHLPLNSFTTNETDMFALLSFKSLMSNNGTFGALSSWNDSFHYCQWQGVRCSNCHPDRVTALSLGSLSLSGLMSPSLANLTFLKSLNLSDNQLSGNIPAELGHLSRLQFLDLSVNNLDGNIPSTLGNCSNLEELNLYRNNLTESIPSTLGNLTHLFDLCLRDNNLDGFIPPSLGQLKALEYLSLSENYLSGKIPHSIYNLSAMISLSLSVNQLDGNLPSNFCDAFQNLQIIAYYKNQLNGQIPISISNCSAITMIDLSSNNFRGTIPNRDFDEAIRDFDEVIQKGIVLKDDLAFGKDFIQSHLMKEHPMKDFIWTPRLLSENLFLIDTPNVQWRAMVVAHGQIVLGDVVFPVAPFDFLSHDGGSDPVQVWVNIKGFPPKLWRTMEFRRLVESFGGFLIDVDPRSSGHYDFSVLRLKVGVPDVRCIPDARVLHYVGDAQQHRYYFLTFEVDGWKQGRGTNIFRPRAYWQEKRGRDDQIVQEPGTKVRRISERQGIVIGEQKFQEVKSKKGMIVHGKGKGIMIEERKEIDEDEDEDLLDSNPFSILGDDCTHEERTVETIGESSKGVSMAAAMPIVVVPPPVLPEPRHSVRLRNSLVGRRLRG